MVTHMNTMWLALQQAANYPGWGTDMVLLLVAAIGNTAGMNEQTIPTFMAGGTLGIFESRGWTPEKMADTVDDWGVTHTVVFPSMMEPFLHADAQSEIGFGTVRFMLTGGENTPPATLARFRRRWSHITVALAYGSTESGLPTMIFDGEIDRHPGSVGRVTMGHTVRIQDGDGKALGVGEIGEIWVASPGTVAGYWNAPEVNAEVVRDGWLNTGDLGRFDEDGYLYLQGRSRDLIISKGQNIYPAEIENVLSEFEDLLEFTVVGVPDEEFGEAVCAVAVAKPDREVTGNDVIEFVRERLASYKKPRYVVFLDELPRNAGNKVLKRQVVEQVSRELTVS
jgi:fatty-acyl-CoA synthase